MTMLQSPTSAKLTLTQTAYAARVGLTQGRISQLVAAGLPTTNGRIDPATADAWIEANIDHDRREREKVGRAYKASEPVATPAATRAATRAPIHVETAEARRQKMCADAGLAKLKLLEREGDLVPKDAAENLVFEEARKIRDGLIAWVARTAPALAHELDADPQATFSALDRLIREHLAELSS